MPESTYSNLLLLDVTAKFRPDKVDHAGGVNMEDIVWDTPEDRESFWGTAKGIYEDLAKVAESTFSVSMPEFDQDMFELVSFSGEARSGTIADYHPSSGHIRISTAHNRTWLDVMKSMAHEIGHFAAIRKIFTNGADEVPARVGVSVIGHRVASPDGKTPFEFQQYRGDMINEALTEITAAEMVNQLKGKYNFIPPEGVQPESYSNERRLYSALVDAITYSWNNPDFREKTIVEREFWKDAEACKNENQTRIGVIKSRLDWQDQIDSKQVDQLFREALTHGDGLTKVSHLVNACLGEKAFEKMWDAKPGDMNVEAWNVVRPFSRARAYAKEDLILSIGGIGVQIEASDTPENVIFQTYEEQDGEKLGIQEVFANYERLLASPISKEDINLYAERVNQLRKASHNEYPFGYGLPIVHEASRNSLILKSGKPTLDFCFGKLTETLGVDLTQPKESKSTEVLGVKYTTEYFACEKHPGVTMARVKVDDEINDTSNTRYFFVK